MKMNTLRWMGWAFMIGGVASGLGFFGYYTYHGQPDVAQRLAVQNLLWVGIGFVLYLLTRPNPPRDLE